MELNQRPRLYEGPALPLSYAALFHSAAYLALRTELRCRMHNDTKKKAPKQLEASFSVCSLLINRSSLDEGDPRTTTIRIINLLFKGSVRRMYIF